MTDKPIRILMAIPHGDFSVGGGSSVQLSQTRQHLEKHGVTVEMFDPGLSYARGDADLVHLFGANAAMYDLSQRLADLQIPYVVSTIFFTMHHPRYLQMAVKLEQLSKKFVGGIWTDYGIIHAVCRGAQAILPNTSAEALLLRDGLRLPKGKIHVIPNGVEERFASASADLFEQTYDIRNFILYVGNLGSLRKNALNLIRALAKVETPAVLVGKIFDNDYGNQCRKEAARHNHIHLLGPLGHDDPLLASAYAAAKVFVLPAYFETPGIAAMEAGLANTRIVITKNGGTHDYFADMAHYVDPKSVASIHQGLVKALADKSGPSRLRRHLLENFLWSATAAKTAAVYRRVLEDLNGG